MRILDLSYEHSMKAQGIWPHGTPYEDASVQNSILRENDKNEMKRTLTSVVSYFEFGFEPQRPADHRGIGEAFLL